MLASTYPSAAHRADPSEPRGAIHVKMIDFGCARSCPGDAPSLEGLSGTPAYMAPEVARGAPYGRASDMWGVAVIAYQLLTGRFPHWDCALDRLAGMPTRQVLADVAAGDVMLDTPACRALSPAARDLLGALFELDPEKRPPAYCAMQHPWMVAHGTAPAHAHAPAAAVHLG
jgi:serine/threonine protein kinase